MESKSSRKKKPSADSGAELLALDQAQRTQGHKKRDSKGPTVSRSPSQPGSLLPPISSRNGGPRVRILEQLTKVAVLDRG